MSVPLVLGFLMHITACGSEAESHDAAANDTGESIPFAGTWSREFEAGPGNLTTATYVVDATSIRYTLVGSVGNADYRIVRDEFVASENRFIGHTERGEYYAIFVRDIGANITLYKQAVSDLAAGIALSVPANDNAENRGWNIYMMR